MASTIHTPRYSLDGAGNQHGSKERTFDMRDKLNNRRSNLNLAAKILGLDVIVSLGFNEEGRIREVFIDPVKFGSSANTTVKELAILFSFLMQYGCPIDEIVDVLPTDTYGKPEGAAGEIARLIKENDDVPTDA